MGDGVEGVAMDEGPRVLARFRIGVAKTSSLLFVVSTVGKALFKLPPNATKPDVDVSWPKPVGVAGKAAEAGDCGKAMGVDANEEDEAGGEKGVRAGRRANDPER